MPAEYIDPQAQIMDFITTLSEGFEEVNKEDAGASGSSSSECEREGEDKCPKRHGGKGKGKGGRGRHGHGHGPWEARGEGFGPRDGHGLWGPHGGRGGFFAGPFGGRGGFFGGRGGRFGHGPHGHHNHHNQRNGAQEFSPSVDVFDSPAAYTLHVALPGAAKEDVGIHYDYDHHELQISGVVHRPGDEEFLKTLVSSERLIGAFERKIKLGKPSEPSLVEADGITAKYENGILEIVVPKKEKAPEQERKKIEIE